MDPLADAIQIFFMVFFTLFFISLAIYYFSKKAFEEGVALLILSAILVIAYFFNLISLLSSLVFFLFFVSVYNQYSRKKATHQLIWSIAMAMFFLTTGFQAIASFFGYWEPLNYRFYYILTSFQVLLLGLGELYLLSSRKVINEKSVSVMLVISGFIWMLFGFIGSKSSPLFLGIAIPGLLILVFGLVYAVLLLLKSKKIQLSGLQFSNLVLIFSCYIFLISIYFAFTLPLDVTKLSTGAEVGGEPWGASAAVRLISPIFTISGALFIFLGSIYSYIKWQMAIKKQTGSFNSGVGIFNIYFAIGVIIFTTGGVFSRFGVSLLYITEIVGGIFMYFGFLESDKISLEMIMDIVTLRFLRKHYQISETIVS